MEIEDQDSMEGTYDLYKRTKHIPAIEASKVYLLMPYNVPVSRTARLQWLIEHLNTIVLIPSSTQMFSNDELEIISAIPMDGNPSLGNNHYLITSNTQLEFLAHSYRFVYCLDMSPSQASVDLHLNEILFDEIINSFETSLLGLCKRFTIPGNAQVFQPCIYLTVIVNTPFFISPAQQVLVKGVQVSSQNVAEIVYSVRTQFHYIEGRIAHMSALAYDEIERLASDNEDFISQEAQYSSNIPLVPSDANFVNMLRYSMLALSLLPEISLSHIIIITDGVVAMPDSNIMESIIFQLHYDSISLSFIKVGSAFTPHLSAGCVAYSDLLHFLSCSTLGICLESLPPPNSSKNMNTFQQLYLFWSFNSKVQISQSTVQKELPSRPNTFCYGVPPLLTKKQAENDVKVPLLLLLYRRMREGYTVGKVSLNNGILEVRLSRHWKAYIYIQYILTSSWPVFKNVTHYEIHVTAPYDFLHDITCLMKKETKSSYRQAVFEKFWLHLIQLATNDIVVQLSSFQTSNVWYTLPESVKNGVPLFTANESQTYDSNKLILSVNGKSCPKFTSIWQPICQIETSNWRKWFHVHKISLILKHDSPLSKYVHLMNPSGRYEIVQCRLAATSLYEFLSKWSSFVLIDNHTYLKLIERENNSPLFCIIRITLKFPCTTLTVGFMTGTSGGIRFKVLEELRKDLSHLTYLSNPIKKRESKCCTLLNKPLEKICIKYERVPSEFHTVIFPDGTQPPHSSQSLPVSPLAGTLFTTLSRYLFHQRWIWSGNYHANPKLEMRAISRILTTITKIRLKEGFHLAHSASGIITMVLELPMSPALSCIVQYVLFPPHDALAYDADSFSEDEQEGETDTELQIVTEVWIEPQYGTVEVNQSSRVQYMENKYYYELSDEIRRSDYNCVNSLLTLEHLSLMCQQKQNEIFDSPRLSRQSSSFRSHMLSRCAADDNGKNDETGSVWIPLLVQRIQHIPFTFNPITILKLCQQTELLFSMFSEGNNDRKGDVEKANLLLLENLYNDMICLHDRELEIEDSMKFTEHIFSRHPSVSREIPNVRWRCFLKGVSVTHVILAFIPTSIDDLKNYVTCVDSETLCLPIYVYDCPLGLLVDACVENQGANLYKKDVFQDHRFKMIEDQDKFNLEEEISLNPEDGDSEETDYGTNVKQHCKTIALTHCKCFVTSLYAALHQNLYINRGDVQAAMDQCEETIYKIDITEYLQTICGHLKDSEGDKISLISLEQYSALKPIHSLIKEKFYSITNKAFTVIPTNQEFYFCDNLNIAKLEDKSTDSDDEVISDNVDFQSDSYTSTVHQQNGTVFVPMTPLFLHYVATVQYDDYHENIPVKLLPTCLKEICDVIDVEITQKCKLYISLDVLCLTLPGDVQNVITGYSSKGLRTTSFCSDGFQLSTSGSASEGSCNSSFNLEELGGLSNVPDIQRRAIHDLIEEIKWLLKDEIAHSLLDVNPVTENTLKFVSKHIAESRSRESCRMDVIELNFVYKPSQSYEKFMQEFGKISVPEYQLCQVDDIYYLSKLNEEDVFTDYDSDYNLEEDSKFQWLIELHKKRKNLPNFWLIMEIHHDAVTIYFHCRYLELPTIHVGVYLKVQRDIHDAIKDLCKQVNQYLLLQSLHDTRTCNVLLEPDDSLSEWKNDTATNSGAKSFSRLKCMEESNDECELYSATLTEASLKFKAGYFSCPVVWETHFVLHPRFKTGPGKAGLSAGISTLKTVLDKFSVTNRCNMFVYQDNKMNVFYLRLHENYNYYNKNSQSKLNEFENVSRSPSVTSLPLGHQKSTLPVDGTVVSCAIADVRPRVRSFGEKETKEDPHEDTIILRVHGITETGQDVRCELVQVLQNRLDDAVLDNLSLTLARNSMCPLTADDVRFLQKPFKPPEYVIRFFIQEYSIKLLDAFTYYLRQNLLQFLNIPKYTGDCKPHYQFKDYSECDQANIITEDNIFIYNQTSMTGNKGISCIALAVMDHTRDQPRGEVDFQELLKRKEDDIVECGVIETEDILPSTYLEFRLWNQGRVNMDNLFQKLYTSASHANWDIIIEYHMLKKQLCVEKIENNTNIKIDSLQNDGVEQRKQVILDATIEPSNMKSRIINYELKFDKLPSQTYKKRLTENLSVQKLLTRDLFVKDLSKNSIPKPMVKMDPYELGEEGQLSETYRVILPMWFKFSDILGVPSVRKTILNLCSQHSLHTVVKELQGLIGNISSDAVRVFIYDSHSDTYRPYISTSYSNEYILIARSFNHWKICQNGDANLANDTSLKQIFKYPPTSINNRFIPRQRILWAKITNTEVTLYVYNWSKDAMDKLIDQTTNLSHWLCMRGCLLSSITAQKLGMFHDQIISRSPFVGPNNPYINSMCDVDLMSKFPRDRTRRSQASVNAIPTFIESFKDTYRIISPYMDSVVTNMLEMCEIKQSNKRHRDDLKALHSMYQSRSSTATHSQIHILMQNSRNIHYCHTPLLFLSRWRVKAARTRDHTIVPTGDTSFDLQMDEQDESWHQELCTYFISEYKHYLQTLGFMTLQVEKNDKKSSNFLFENIHFMQKALLGGILIFTIELKEPFLITKLHAIEYNRLHNNNTKAAINQFMQSFLDECDKVKFFMHLHSFTYDFHLRCVCNYVSENNNSKLKDGYYITSFLNDFMKYYSKAPNYARNLVYTDTVKISNLLTDGKQLYNFLLAHIKQYQFKHIIMRDNKVSDEVEYILVQTTNTPQLSYKDSQDRQHTDDFDVTSIVTDVSPYDNGKDYCLHMKYYLILTSRREIYPKFDNEKKLGKFRTVISLKSEIEKPKDEVILNELEIDTNETDLLSPIDGASLESSLEDSKYDNRSFSSERETDDSDEIENQKPKDKTKPRQRVEIKQESVNYLGYYSSHEQLMQQLILDCANSTETRLREMASQGTIHCRTHMLWNKLLSTQESNKLTFEEFSELKSLAKQENLAEAHPNLETLLKEPIQWYQDFAKLLVMKYSEHYRVFVSPDESIWHYVILHPRYSGAFMMLSLDLDISRGNIYIVNRPADDVEESHMCVRDRNALINGFINCVCFYLWMNMI
nr:KICSTOR complex protein SZT2-like isoform X1 [Onthophagus taurus]